MILVRLLGAQSVTDAAGRELHSVSSQPKRLALLTYLAVTCSDRDGSVNRDELLALFWPESDDEHARNNLNQYLYRLRGSLGSDALPSHGSSRVGVSPDEVWCDAVEFCRAIDDGDVEQALDLYSGELLPGFHVSGSPELEKWLDQLRLDLRRMALNGALRLARRSDEAGERTAASRWYRRALEIDPENLTAARGLSAAAVTPPAPVTSSAAMAPPRPAAPVAAGNGRLMARSNLPYGAVIVAAALAIGGWWVTSSRERLPDPEPRVAFLPIVNMTGDSTFDRMIEVVHDEIIRRTGMAGGVQVISRTSVVGFRDDAPPLPEIGRRLGVEAIVEAAVRTLADSLDVQFRLLDAESERTLWSDSYRVPGGDSIEILRRLPWLVANEVRQALSAESSLDLEPPREPGPAAFEAYLRGRDLVDRGGGENLDRAIEEFMQAAELDQHFAEAWVGLGDAWRIAGGWFGHRSSAEAMPFAQNAYDRALAADSTLAEAYAGLAIVEWHFRWRWSEAETAFRRSIDLNPSLASTRDHYGNFLRSMRRVEEGVVQLERAVELDPLGRSWAELRAHYQHLGRFTDAREAAERAKALHPDDPGARFVYALELWGDGDRQAATDSLVAAGIFGFAAQLYAVNGQAEEARALVARLEASPNRNHLPIANTYLLLGDTARALDWLELGVSERHPHMVWLDLARSWSEDGYEPIADGFPQLGYAGPRYDAIMRKMEFPERSARP